MICKSTLQFLIFDVHFLDKFILIYAPVDKPSIEEFNCING